MNSWWNVAISCRWQHLQITLQCIVKMWLWYSEMSFSVSLNYCQTDCAYCWRVDVCNCCRQLCSDMRCRINTKLYFHSLFAIWAIYSFLVVPYKLLDQGTVAYQQAAVRNSAKQKTGWELPLMVSGKRGGFPRYPALRCKVKHTEFSSVIIRRERTASGRSRWAIVIAVCLGYHVPHFNACVYMHNPQHLARGWLDGAETSPVGGTECP